MPVRNRHSGFDEPLDDGHEDLPRDPRDPFAPPPVPVEVCCMQCGGVYESWQMIWLDDPTLPGGGVWCCPVDGCDGIGYGFDIWPTDPQADFACREEEDELRPFDDLQDDSPFVDPTDDTLDQSAPDDGGETRDSAVQPDVPQAPDDGADESTNPSSAYLTRSLVYELLSNNEDWYEFFHQRDLHDEREQRNKLDDRTP